jgi:hypothetical protein
MPGGCGHRATVWITTVLSGSSTRLRDDQGAPGLLARLTAPTERATNASSPISCPAAHLSMAAATSSTNPPTGGAQAHRSGSPTQQPYVSARRSRSQRLRGKLLSGRRVGHNDTFPSHRKINLPRRTKSNPVTIAPPEQLRHRAAMARKVPFTRHAGAPRRRRSDFTISFWRRSFSNSTCSANFLFHVVAGHTCRRMTISLSDLVLNSEKISY